MTTTTPQPSARTALPSGVPSRTPLPLSAGQEQQVRDIYYKRVRTKCADEIRDFATCAQSRTFTSTFMCRAPQRAMNSCMLLYATMDEQDRAREEWFATRDQRKAEREERERKKREAEVFHRKWWGLDGEGRRKVGTDAGVEELVGEVPEIVREKMGKRGR